MEISVKSEVAVKKKLGYAKKIGQRIIQKYHYRNCLISNVISYGGYASHDGCGRIQKAQKEWCKVRKFILYLKTVFHQT